MVSGGTGSSVSLHKQLAPCHGNVDRHDVAASPVARRMGGELPGPAVRRLRLPWIGADSLKIDRTILNCSMYSGAIAHVWYTGAVPESRARKI